MPSPDCPCPPPLQRLPGHPEFFPPIQRFSVSSSRPLQPSAPSGTPLLPHRVNQRSSNLTIRAAVYISLYVDVNTFIGGRQPQNKLMRLRTFKKPCPNPSPNPAPRRQREPGPPRTSSMTSGPSRPRPEGSSAQRGAPPPSPTPPPPPSWRSAPRPKRDAPRPTTSQSPHPRPTDCSRPSQNDARVHQQRPHPPTNPR